MLPLPGEVHLKELPTYLPAGSQILLWQNEETLHAGAVCSRAGRDSTPVRTEVGAAHQRLCNECTTGTNKHLSAALAAHLAERAIEEIERGTALTPTEEERCLDLLHLNPEELTALDETLAERRDSAVGEILRRWKSWKRNPKTGGHLGILTEFRWPEIVPHIIRAHSVARNGAVHLVAVPSGLTRYLPGTALPAHPRDTLETYEIALALATDTDGYPYQKLTVALEAARNLSH